MTRWSLGRASQGLTVFGSVLALVLAASVAGGPTGAPAQSVAQRAHSNTDYRGFQGTRDTLIDMISKVEQTTGGRVLEIRYTDKDGMPGFRAAVDKAGRVVFLRVAAEKGDAVEIDRSSVPEWMLRWSARQDVKAAERASVSLTDAIRTAEQAHFGGSAVAAGIAASAANPASNVKAYNVLVMRDGDVRRVAVDDSTGQVIADPQALASWP